MLECPSLAGSPSRASRGDRMSDLSIGSDTRGCRSRTRVISRPNGRTAASTCTQRRYFRDRVLPEPFLETYLKRPNPRSLLFTSGFHAVNDLLIQK
eukprot:4696390-Prymnesium_polylepis.1